MKIESFYQVRPTPILSRNLSLQNGQEIFIAIFNALQTISAHKLQSRAKETQMSKVNRLDTKTLCCEINIRVEDLPTIRKFIELLFNSLLYLYILKILVTLRNKTHCISLLSYLFHSVIGRIYVAKKDVSFDSFIEK